MKLSWRGVNLLFLICQSVQFVAEGHLNAFTPLLLHDLGLTPAEIAVWTGLLVASMMLMALPLAPFWGVLAERYSRRPIVLRGYILLAVALLIAAFAQDVRWLVAARVLMGLCFGTGGVIMATQAMVTPRNRLGTAIATVQAAQPVAASLGPPLGAIAIPYIGLRQLFIVDALATLAVALALAFLMPDPVSRASKGSVMARTGEVLKMVWTNQPVRWNFLAAFLMRGGTSVVDAYLPVRITQLAVDPAAAIGWILGIYGALTTVATWLVGRLIDRTDAAGLFSRAMVLATAITAGMALAPSIWLLGLLAALRSIPVSCGNTVLYAHAARVLPAEAQTPVFALSPVPRNLSQFLFPLLAALVAGLAPWSALGLGAFALCATSAVSLRMVAVTRSQLGTRRDIEDSAEPATG